VKSAKFHFTRVAGASILAIDELRTLAYEISAILNSRPLCPISENAESLEVLTPAHFLKGSSYPNFPEPDITHLRDGRLNRWQRVTQMQQHFWKKWSTEYLSLLQEGSKWRVETCNESSSAVRIMWDWIILNYVVFFVVGQDSFICAFMSKESDFMHEK